MARDEIQPSANRFRWDWYNDKISSLSAVVGVRQIKSLNAKSARSRSVATASRSTRSASARAESTNSVSFNADSAARGLLDRVRRGQEKSPFGASNDANTGSGIDRRRNMYNERRYRSGIEAVCQKSAAGI